ncbi:MAG: hypothetical protein HZB91_14440 [Elusimicrobia bacterium]|nr:hypothetical protein [Elusimicrobiota bacterium]
MHRRKTAVLKTETKLVPSTPKAAASVTIDYPRPNEKVNPGHYAIRVTATEGTPSVMVSIDGGGFSSCRFDGGYWYFDYQASEGRHSVVARTSDGSAETRARRFEVLNGNHH